MAYLEGSHKVALGIYTPCFGFLCTLHDKPFFPCLTLKARKEPTRSTVTHFESHKPCNQPRDLVFNQITYKLRNFQGVQ